MTPLVSTTLVLVLLLELTLTPSSQAADDEILRTNYGYAIKATGNRVQLTSNHGRIVFHFNIRHQKMLRDIPALQNEPRLHWGPSLVRDSFTSSLGHPCLGQCRYNECNECHSILDIARKLFHLRQDMRTLLHMRQREISELILDLESPPRQKRGLGTLIGGALGRTFGLATDSDVEEIKHLMYEVLQGSKQAVNAWSQGQNLVTRVTQLTSERFQHIDQLLNLTH